MPSIIPALPTRPAVNRTSTLTQTDGAIAVAAGTSESGFNVLPLVSLFYGGLGLRLQFSNAGTIWSEGAFSGVTAIFGGSDMFDATNSGTIVAHNTYNDPFFAPQANAFAVTSGNSTLNNSGQIFAIADFGRATAISVGDAFFKLNNSGLIAAQASIIDTAIGVSLNNGLFTASDGRAGAFLNQAGGQILAEGGIAYGVLASDAVSNLVNNGRIEAASTNPNGVSYGVLVSFMSSQFQPTGPLSTITNAGTIKGDYSIWATGFINGPNLPGAYVQSILNQAGGQLIGTVFTGIGADSVINAGTIDGAIILNQGNDLFDTSAGTVHGVVDMGWDQDHYIGSAGDDDVLGGRNADLLEGNGGDDLLIGEQGNDTIIGGAGNDGIYGGSGEDTITTQDGDWVHGGDGNDTIFANDLTFERIDGGLGTDTLTLPGTGNLLDLAGAFADGRLESIEQINLAAGQQILLRSNTGFAGFGSEIVLAGSASNAVTLAGTFSEAAQVVRGGQTYRTFTSGGMSILVDADAQIAIQSKVTNPGGGLAAIAGGALAPLANPNGPYHLYDGVWAPDVTYSLTSSVLIDADETIENPTGSGRLFTADPLGFGITQSARLENHGTLISGGPTTAGGTIYYGRMAVDNYGTIIGEANAVNGGVHTLVGPVSYNSGLIAAHGGWSSVAVDSVFAFFDLVNDGRIEATGFSNSGTAVFMENGSPINNHGQIVASGGGYAVAIQGTGSSSLVNTNTISAQSNSNTVNEYGQPLDKGTAIGLYGVKQLNNSGLIEAISTTGMAIAVEGTQANADFNRGRYFFNTGEIVAKGFAPSNFGNALDLQVSAIALRIGGGDVINDGTIRAEVLSGAAFGTKSIGMWVGQNSGFFFGGNGVTNNGTISADIAIRFFRGSSTDTSSTVPFWVTNNGTINGEIWFANGDDQYTSATGRTNGIVYAFGGNDVLIGGAFADWFEGGDGNDTLNGGGGADRASYSQALGSVIVDLRISTAQNTGGAGIDTLISIEELIGSDFADSLTGNADANYLAGGGGDDVLTGLGGNDTFDGGTGINDEARYAGNRADYLIENVLIGGLDYVRITGLGGAAGDGIDLLRNVEFAQFADQRVAIAPPRPSLGTPAMPDQNVGDSIPYIFQIPAGSFVDPDLSTPLGFAATLADGSPLPGWLSFNPNTRTFTGTAPFALIGTVLQVKVTATDSDPNHPGESVSDIFALTIVASSPYQVGTAGPDTLIGTSASERLFGNDGDDTFIGSAGSDTIVGSNGIDLVDYSNWILNVEVNLTNGTASKNDFDPVWGIFAAGTDALSGVESVRGTAFSDTLFGSSNNDVFWGGDGNDGITGMDGDDRLFGEAGDDALVGWNGNDWLDGGIGADSMEGGEGDDTFIVDNVGDRASDSGGIDTVRTSLSTYALSIGIENLIYTGTGASTLTGNDLDNLIYGGIGADAMYGGNGNDIYVVNDPGDTVFESANDGIDTVQSSINIYALSDDVENLQFTGSGNASLTGNLLENAISGGSGNDILSGQGGIDNLSGLAGNDRLVLTAAGSGSFVDGGANFDTLAVSGAVSLGGIAGIEAIELTAGANLTLTTSQLMAGLAPNTQLSGSGTITINLEANVFAAMTGFQGLGAPINFLLIGSAGDDYIKASHFANTINGGAGRDFVRGGNGIDTIDGGTEADKITGWGGADILTGGSGNDQFRYLYATDSGVGVAADRITDFTIGGDVIDLRLLDRDLVAPDIQSYSLSFIGSAAFGGTGASQIRYTTSGANMLVQFDLDGNGSSDMEIILQGLAGQTLSASDFLFASAGAEPLPAVKEAAPAVMEDLAWAAESAPVTEPLLFDPAHDTGLVRWLDPMHDQGWSFG